MKILVLNCGSYSLKYQLLDMENENVIAKGYFERIGSYDSFVTHKVNGEKYRYDVIARDHGEAIKFVLKQFTDEKYPVIKSLDEISAIGHRVVHGGERFQKSCIIDEDVKKGIEDAVRFAPLHNPAHLQGIKACEVNLPGKPNVAVFDTIAALLAAFVIIPGMAAGGAELSSGGPGLMFIYLVNVFNGMPGGKIVGIVFYVCVLFAGMSSLVNLYEAPVATIQEKLKLNRVASVGIIAVAGCVVSLVIQGIVSGWMDAVSIYICPLGAMLAAIMFFWVAGKKFAVDAVNAGADKPIGKWFVPLGKYVLVPLSLVALIAGALLGGIG